MAVWLYFKRRCEYLSDSQSGNGKNAKSGLRETREKVSRGGAFLRADQDLHKAERMDVKKA